MNLNRIVFACLVFLMCVFIPQVILLANTTSMQDLKLSYETPNNWKKANVSLNMELKDSYGNPESFSVPFAPRPQYDFRLQLWFVPGAKGADSYHLDADTMDGSVTVITTLKSDPMFSGFQTEEEFQTWLYDKLGIYEDEEDSFFVLKNGKRDIWYHTIVENKEGEVIRRRFLHYREMEQSSVLVTYEDSDEQRFLSQLGTVGNLASTFQPYEASSMFFYAIVIVLTLVGVLLAGASLVAKRKEAAIEALGSVQSIVASAPAVSGSSDTEVRTPAGSLLEATMPASAPVPSAPRSHMMDVDESKGTPAVAALFPSAEATTPAPQTPPPSPVTAAPQMVPASTEPQAQVPVAEAPATPVVPETPVVEETPQESQETGRKTAPPPTIPMLSKHGSEQSKPKPVAAPSVETKQQTLPDTSSPAAELAVSTEEKTVPVGAETTETAIDPSLTLCPEGVTNATQEFPAVTDVDESEKAIDPSLALCAEGVTAAATEFPPQSDANETEKDIDPKLALCPVGVTEAATEFPAQSDTDESEKDIDPSLALCAEGVTGAATEFPASSHADETEKAIDPELSLCPSGVTDARDEFPASSDADASESDIDPALALCPDGVQGASEVYAPNDR